MLAALDAVHATVGVFAEGSKGLKRPVASPGEPIFVRGECRHGREGAEWIG